MLVDKKINFSELPKENPWKLFADLYLFIKGDFTKIANSLFTEPGPRVRFEDLSLELFNSFIKSGYSGVLDKVPKISCNYDYNLFSVALFKALGQYLSKKGQYELKWLNSINIGNLTITARPQNLIYENLKNPIRSGFGVNIHDIVDLKDISIIEEMNPKIGLLRKEELLIRTNTYLKRRINRGLKIAVLPFRTKREFETESLLNAWPVNQSTPFWVKEIKNAESSKNALFAILKKCAQNGVNILVLPELTIDANLLDFVKDWLSENNSVRVSSGGNGLLLVVAGSFHIQDGDDKIYNISSVLNHNGEILWTQGKIQPYSFNCNDIETTPELKTILKTSNNGGHERITSSDRIWCFDTPLGRMAVSICIDYFHSDHLEAFRHSGINIFLVPAMSSSNIRFTNTAWSLGGNNLASSFVALGDFLPPKKDMVNQNNTSFYYLPDTKRSYTYAVYPEEDLLIFELKLITG